MRSRLKRVTKNQNPDARIGWFILGFFAGSILAVTIIRAKYEVPMVSPLGEPKTEVKTIEVHAIEPENPIEAEIREVFGEYSDKALLLLKGRGDGTCAENRTLNPKAVNDNTEWGGTGQDLGVFQINNYWQGFRHYGKSVQFLFDPSINIRVAWRIFVDEGYSFSKWTCGRYYGI